MPLAADVVHFPQLRVTSTPRSYADVCTLIAATIQQAKGAKASIDEVRTSNPGMVLFVVITAALVLDTVLELLSPALVVYAIVMGVWICE